jgi:vancomycin permeability regulator SanA
MLGKISSHGICKFLQMQKKNIGKYFKKPAWVLGIAILSLIIIDLLWISLKFPSSQCSANPQSLPPTEKPALVLGAGVRQSGEPTQVLEGRLQAALTLYTEKKIKWILVSGDNRTQFYNEPQAMRRWLMKRGVPPNKIVSDYAGRRTYDSLKRAKIIFGIDNAIIVTSDFHMPRALYLAKHLGIEAQGIQSSTKSIGLAAHAKFRAREHLARHIAIKDAWFPPSTMLGPLEATPQPPEAK